MRPGIKRVAFDIDGTLTDATTWWGGETVGWVQRYSVRDGEAMLRLSEHVAVVPLSRNKTRVARERMLLLGLDVRWLGVADKGVALQEICAAYNVQPHEVCAIGDGPDDARVFAEVGLAVAVADAHVDARAAATHCLSRKGGQGAMEALEQWLHGKHGVCAIGLMSGTSGDGVDAVMLELDSVDSPHDARILGHTYVPFDAELRRWIRNPMALTLDQVAHMHAWLPQLYAQAVRALPQWNRADVIGMHGQTVFHAPPSRAGDVATTLQLGSSGVLAALLGKPVVGEMRAADMALGGEGAPIAPLAHWFFASGQAPVMVVNIGGIANATWVTAAFSDVRAGDLGPGMMITDALAAAHSNGTLDHDRDGSLSEGGCVHNPMLEAIMRHPFFSRAKPASTGREDFGVAFTAQLQAQFAHVSTRDQLRTSIAATAQVIADAARATMQEHGNALKVVLTGGGAQHPTLVADVCERAAPLGVAIGQGALAPNIHEGAAMALIAARTLHRVPSSMPQVTGASRAAVLGHIHWPSST